MHTLYAMSFTLHCQSTIIFCCHLSGPCTLDRFSADFSPDFAFLSSSHLSQFSSNTIFGAPSIILPPVLNKLFLCPECVSMKYLTEFLLPHIFQMSIQNQIRFPCSPYQHFLAQLPYIFIFYSP